MFSLCSNFLTTSLVEGNFFKLQGKIQRFKKHRARIHRGYFFTTVQNSYSSLDKASPKPQKQEQMALASLVSFQKQKLTVVKIFMELDIEKAVFQRGNKRTFYATRRHSFINSVQNKHNYLWKKHDSILAYADAP